jgi:hypothetical protein
MLRIRPPNRSTTQQSVQNADGRFDFLDQSRRSGVIITRLAVLDRPIPANRNQRRDTNPIARGRPQVISIRLNEVARSAEINTHRRATSQTPPDTRAHCDLIHERMSRYELTEFGWRLTASLLPNTPRVSPRVDGSPRAETFCGTAL